MGKKKDKTFSYNNTHGHGIYPHYYPISQRYPHTDMHHNDPFWIYEELGILKDWIISLTKLGGMLAQSETDDVAELVEEIQALIDKLNGLFNGVLSALNNLYSSSQKYDSNLLNALSSSELLTYNLNTFIITLANKLANVFSCIENHLKYIDAGTYNEISNIDNSITNIQNEINQIFDYLESQYNSNSKSLVEGTDYDVTFFNGFYLNHNYYGETQTIDIHLSTTELLNTKFYNISIATNHSEYGEHAISNSYVYTADSENDEKAPLFRHGNSWRDVTQSWIFFIKFKNDYAYLNELNFLQMNQGSSNPIWNMSPRSARPSWVVNVNSRIGDIYSNDGSINLGNGLICVMTNISDGINGQYYDYINLGFADSISFGNVLNLDFNIDCN